ncbi:sulfatase [Paracoccus sp. Z330]|uniref:Sulfatase n=1 Tax=Paracoccus onchidii TaxID=3017813 RepID=A0ABT4ZFQ8_9RHOB|nr:sulfatase [Paracoccus onchidii]MDB6178214.1 sulfatase [Paracoccus onchidii]
MRTVFVLFDSLNRLALNAYADSGIATPNFDRFARRSVTFDTHYVGSLPCMPARRDLHTGRLNFLHRHWGPLEPFDESYARTLSKKGVYTHLVTDHLHYFEDGGWGYANAFDSWDYIRGQEYDPLKPVVVPDLDKIRMQFDQQQYPTEGLPDGAATRGNSPKMAWKRSRAAINRDFLQEEGDYPIAKCFAAAFDFLDLNRGGDDWFLQLECFDPHEPFVAPERFKNAYASGYNGKSLDWPLYERTSNSAQEIAEIRGNYAALVAMCDEYFGRLLDYFDRYDLWKDTALVLTTDHGFLLSEHDWWGKNRMPYYEEVSHIPLMVWHPECAAGERRAGLTQTPDLMPTFLEMHGCDLPETVTATSLMPALRADVAGHDDVILGMFGGPVCATDGRYSYFLYPDDPNQQELDIYTLMPAHLSSLFDIDELKTAKLSPPFDFTKGAPVMRLRLSSCNSQVGNDGQTLEECETVLYDLHSDPGQKQPIEDPAAIERLRCAIVGHFRRHDAPHEIYGRFGLSAQMAAQIPEQA